MVVVVHVATHNTQQHRHVHSTTEPDPSQRPAGVAHRGGWMPRRDSLLAASSCIKHRELGAELPLFLLLLSYANEEHVLAVRPVRTPSERPDQVTPGTDGSFLAEMARLY